MNKLTIPVGITLLTMASAATGQEQAEEAQASHDGAYALILGSYTKVDDSRRAKDGYGATAGLGYRLGALGFEVAALHTALPADSGGSDTALTGAGVDVLVFPFETWQLFGLVGLGFLEGDKHPDIAGPYSTVYLEAGAGYLLPMAFGTYEFGVRADVRARYSERSEAARSNDGPRRFDDYVLNLGLNFPFGSKQQEAPAGESVAVVPPATSAPAASPDSDGDGVTDAVDQCPGTAVGAAVDDLGCASPPCKTPGPGERVDLTGCGTGDVVVLQGVNFESGQARLTTNARTILDGVAKELSAHPALQVELGGHTDAQGSDEYNQQLSQRRAQAVLEYLVSKGVARGNMTAAGYGESQPMDTNDTAEGRERNRRVELKILSETGTAPAPAAAEPQPAEPVDETPAPADQNEQPSRKPSTSDGSELDELLEPET